MKHLFFLLALLWISVPSIAQSIEPEKLKARLAELGETKERVDVLTDLAESYNKFDPDSAEIFIREARQLAGTLRYTAGIAEALRIHGFIYFDRGELDTAMRYFRQAKERFEKLEDRVGQGYVLTNIGNVLRQKGELSEAREQLQTALGILQGVDDTTGLIRAHNDLAIVYAYENNFPYSLENFQASLRYAKAANDIRNMSYAYSNIGSVYDMIGQDDEAIPNYQKGLDYKMQINDRSGMAIGYFNLASLYSDRDQFDQALPLFRNALDLFLELGNQFGEMNCYENIGNMFFAMEKPDSARHLYKKALSMSYELGDQQTTAKVLFQLAEVNLAQGRKQKALEQVEKAYRIAEDLGGYALIGDVEKVRSKVYEALGRHADALAAYKVFKASDDSIKNDSKIERITQLKKEYEFEQEKQALELRQQKREALLQAKIERERSIQQWVMLVLVLVVIGLFLAIRSYRIKQKANRQLQESNTLINQQKEEILAQRDAMTEKNALLEQRQEEILAQRDEISSQRDKLVRQQEDITASLSYAHRIQSRLMPTPEQLFSPFREGFVMLRPRDGVSGDFYWGTSTTCPDTGEALHWVAAVDCTGHGVPGALLSILGLEQLDKIINERRLTQPDEVLEQLDRNVRRILRSESRSLEDGMDMSLCVVRPETQSLSFAGARNGMLLSLGGQPLERVRATRRSIGEKIYKNTQIPFERHTFMLKPDTQLFLYSDGMPDQFGGTKKRKFGFKRFQRLFESNLKQPAAHQHLATEQALEEWQQQGNERQIDDILVIGVKV